MRCDAPPRGSSECTVILGVMYHSNMRGRCDVRAVLIARAFPLVSVVFRAIHFLFVSVRRIETLVEAMFSTWLSSSNGTSIRFFLCYRCSALLSVDSGGMF
ncbi:conserved hypothetical protein [Trichinella spiralis]|uniref:hypothetical protein n=1 Tax=Trichinella spiralis TaxID=6334 RepID=UPI0001EFE9EE|nr:conserved hypothetical protein [Trichinella spiralis]